MSARDHLAALVAALPPDGSVTIPVAWATELLGAATLPAHDLTVGELAARFRLGSSTVRGWLEHGDLPGAYKLGKDWRVPIGAVETFEAERRRRRSGSHGTEELAAWRQERQGTA